MGRLEAIQGFPGLDFLEAVNSKGLETPVVVITGQGDELIASRIIQAGAYDYLPKAKVSGKALLRIISNALEKAGLKREMRMAQEKLAAMVPRIEASARAMEENGTNRGYFGSKKTMILGDLARRVKFLQDNGKGHRHGNGGGFVSDNAHVAAAAYVGPNAMVLDGARVEGNACIKEFAVVFGPRTVVSGNAKIGAMLLHSLCCY